MIRKICSVYDLKACLFGQPWFAVNEGDAMRAFGDVVSKSDTPIAAHPGDYQLFAIGDFDDVKGIVTGITPAKLLCLASAFRPVVAPVNVEVANGSKA